MGLIRLIFDIGENITLVLLYITEIILLYEFYCYKNLFSICLKLMSLLQERYTSLES